MYLEIFVSGDHHLLIIPIASIIIIPIIYSNYQNL